MDRHRIIELERVDSTNSFAERLTREMTVPDGTVIWAHDQTAGKGQGENVWHSEPGKSLTMTMIRYPVFLAVDRQFLLNKSVSLGVLDFVHALLPEGPCRIKWPNDICYGSSKLGGILINHSIPGNTFGHSVIGIGINVNETSFDPVVPDPVSIRQITSGTTDLETALKVLIEKLDDRYRQLKRGSVGLLDREYKNSLMGVNEERRFKTVSGIFTGIIRDVDQFGRLIVESGDKGHMIFSHGEIESLK